MARQISIKDSDYSNKIHRLLDNDYDDNLNGLCEEIDDSDDDPDFVLSEEEVIDESGSDDDED